MTQRSQFMFVCMILLSCVVGIIISSPLSVQRKQSSPLGKSRQARNLYQFGTMVTCMTNRSAIDFVDYGCWCGYGGNGTAVDDVDRCCEVHDKCYDAIIASGICTYSFHVYTILYRYQDCNKCVPISSYPVQEAQDAPCMKAVCECDSAAALCFSQAHFNSSYIMYPQSKC